MTEPTGYTALDLIGFTDRGTYNAATAYVKNDLVHYLGDIWRCLIDDTTGITPVEGTNWTLFIESPTNEIEGIIAPVETNPVTNFYAVGRQFIYNGNLYIVLTAITAGDTLVAYEDDPSNANIQLADPVETQLLNFEEKAYSTDDSAETSLTSDDLVPFYDTSAAGKKKMTVANLIGQTVSNPNLLDNPWFTVNQRGQSSYTVTGHTVDRFKLTNNTGKLDVTDDGIELIELNDGNEWIQQELGVDIWKLLKGRTVTFSILMADGTLHTLTGTIPTTLTESTQYFGVTLDTNIFVATSIYLRSSGSLFLQIGVKGNNTLAIRAVKLELGSISTLAMDVAPNYALELLKCQRYFHIYETQSLRPSNMYDCVPQMRTTPTQSTITIGGTTYYANSADL